MIAASNFRLEDHRTFLRAACDVAGPGYDFPLYFDVHPNNAESIDIDEPNWAAVSLIYPAMLMGQDLVIEADISPTLLENLRNDFMALTTNFEPLAKPIRVEAGVNSAPRYRNADADICTGFSFGVDSMSTLARYFAPDTPVGARLTSVAVYQVGAFGSTTNPNIDINRARARCETLLGPLGLKVYSLSSNMDSVFSPAAKHGPTDFMKTVGFRNAAASLLLQRGIGRYFASSNVEYGRATYGPWFTTESLDPAFQPLLSTEALGFQSGVAGVSRYDKILRIADSQLAQQHLDVCVGPIETRSISGAVRNNCSRCWKCSQTMIALDSIGKLDAFSEVFDVQMYRANTVAIQRIGVTDAWHKGPKSTAYAVIQRSKQAGLSLPRPRTRLEQKIGRGFRKLLKRSMQRAQQTA